MTRLTAEIYWASLQPEVAAIRYLVLEERFSKAQELASRGFILDRACQVDQEMLPEDVMQVRLNNGFTWVPSADQPNIPTMPGADLPGLPAYNPNPPYPPRSIKVSVDAKDYPPFNGIPPVAPKPVVGEGFQTNAGMIYLPGLGADQVSLSEGQPITQNGVDYIAHYNASGHPEIWFTRK